MIRAIIKLLLVMLVLTSCTNSYDSCYNKCKQTDWQGFVYTTTCKEYRSETFLYDYGYVEVSCEKVNKVNLTNHCSIACRG